MTETRSWSISIIMAQQNRLYQGRAKTSYGVGTITFSSMSSLNLSSIQCYLAVLSSSYRFLVFVDIVIFFVYTASCKAFDFLLQSTLASPCFQSLTQTFIKLVLSGWVKDSFQVYDLCLFMCGCALEVNESFLFLKESPKSSSPCAFFRLIWLNWDDVKEDLRCYWFCIFYCSMYLAF